MGILLATGLAIFTTHKLYRMAWISGIVGNAQVEQRPIADKIFRRGRTGRICYFVLRDHGAADQRPPKLQADCDYWDQKHTGDLVDFVDTGDDAFLREGGIYTSAGNFMFDFLLLAVALTAVIYCVRRLRRRTVETAAAP
jgi:hypothetical protein